MNTKNSYIDSYNYSLLCINTGSTNYSKFNISKKQITNHLLSNPYNNILFFVFLNEFIRTMEYLFHEKTPYEITIIFMKFNYLIFIKIL